MSEKFFGYTVRYVEKDEVIDVDNYNNLVSSIFLLEELFSIHFEQYVESLRDPGLYNYYATYVSTMSEFREKLAKTMYTAVFMAPVYTYHHMDLRNLLLAVAGGMHNLFIYMTMHGITVPYEVKVKLDSAFQILRAYPRLKSGDVVKPEDHNRLVEALKILYDVALQMGLACGKFDVTRYGECAYC